MISLIILILIGFISAATCFVAAQYLERRQHFNVSVIMIGYIGYMLLAISLLISLFMGVLILLVYIT